MRKNNDGYVIIYVIFVILFLCIVAVGTCSSALSNLQNQNRAVEQMKDRYTAQGEMELLVAEICNAINLVNDTSVEDPQASASTKIAIVFSDKDITVAMNGNEYTCCIAVSDDCLLVAAEVVFVVDLHPIETGEYHYKDSEGNIVKESDYDESIHDKVPLYSYTVSVKSHYTSYTIENTGGDAA